MKKIMYLLLVYICGSFTSLGQEKYNISGRISDQEKEPIIGATISILENSKIGLSNINGDYKIMGLKNGTYTIVISSIGFKNDTTVVQVKSQDITHLIELEFNTVYLADVEVKAEKIAERTAISNISFGRKALETSQGLTDDPLRTLASLPGVGRGGDLFSPSQLFIRGGAPDENLFLYDNNKLYFPYYFGGQKSIFNTDVIENVELLTGGFSAAYGNSLSSVMNVQTRDGDFQNYKGNVSFGFYNAGAVFEGPILKNKLSILIAARRTYLDLFLDESASFPLTSLSDITYKLSYKINKKNKLTLSGLSSKEGISFIAADETPGLPNKLETGGTNHFQSLQLKSSIRSKFYNKLSITNGVNENKGEIGSNISLNISALNSGFRDDFSYFISNKHKIKAGVEWQYGFFDFNGNFPLDPMDTDPNDTTVVLVSSNISVKGESIRSAYFLYDGNPIKRLTVDLGLRADQNPREEYIDISPRLALNYQLTENSKVRFATGVFHQFNGDPGVANQPELGSSRAIHYILGYEYRLFDGLYGWVETYYKSYDNLVYYDQFQNYSNTGVGESKGVEFLVRKDKGNFKGWISYALSHSQRTLPIINEVKDFDFDQRHIFNIVLEYKIPVPEKMYYIPALIAINYRYADGTPYTPVTGAVNNGSGWQGIKGEPLSMRNNDYNNLNFRIEWHIDFGESFRMKSFVEIWNLLNFQNVLGRTYQYGTQYDNNVNVQEYYATPFLFGGGFKFEFGK